MMNVQKYFLESVNKKLKEVVQIAAIDFVAVNTLLKEYYTIHKSERQEFSMDTPDKAIKLEAMMSGLQYMDVFNQRVEHLIRVHEKMMTSTMAQHFEESFFHLHVFQSMTIELDLLRSITSIKYILGEMKDFIFHHGEDGASIEKYFAQTEIIKHILQTTIHALMQAGGETRHLSIPVLTAEQVSLLNAMYTMESERVVLTWFLDSMPGGTWEELLQYYEDAINQVEKENTELF